VVGVGERALPAGVKRVLVLGAGRSGSAAARALSRRGLSVVLSDSKAEAEVQDLASLRGWQIEVVLGPQGETQLDGVDLVVKSPGIPETAAIVQAVRRRGLTLYSEVELAFRLVPNPFCAITGTNGKTTTTALLGHMFATAGRPMRVVGNIGVALSSVIDEAEAEAELVTELSSFQLEDVHAFRPEVGILLNLTQDHLDRHGTMEHYLEIKGRMFQKQGPADVAVLNAADGWVREFGQALAARTDPPRVMYFSTAGPQGAESWLEDDRLHVLGRPSLSVGRLQLRGPHNMENCLAAASAALLRGLSLEAVEEALRTFAGVEHRLQKAGNVRGVEYVNDSKATNVEAALKALGAYPRGVHLILGGRDKASDYEPLARACAGGCVSVYLIGEAAPLIRAAFAEVEKSGVPRLPVLLDMGDLERAVAVAAARAQRGEVVLLAPACASFDQYRSFEERGDHFMRLVAQQAKRAG